VSASTPSTRTVTLRRMGRRTAEELWRIGAQDPAWPLRRRTREDWWALVESLWAAEIVDTGAIRAVWTDAAELIGFVSSSLVPPHIAEIPGNGVECGTYLVPSARGRGWNPPVKEAWLHHLFARWPVRWAVFAVPCHNTAARRAFAKLPWPLHAAASPGAEITLSETAASCEPLPWLERWARRKSWETGEPCVVYAVERDAVVIGQGGAIQSDRPARPPD
jgi:RimJ/RimL family protein N-acetyltransferase